MKEIKTILYEIDCPVAFDEEVNAALAAGWSLVRRDVVAPPQQDRAPFFCAELERWVEPEAERLVVTAKPSVSEPCCGNCLYTDEPLTELPCSICSNRSQWEAGSQ